MDPDRNSRVRPVITVDPAVRFGQPHIRGVRTEDIVGMLATGDSAETVCDEYDITRHELLLACWYEGIYGERPEWRHWAETVAGPELAGWVKPLNVDAMPLPTEMRP